MLPELRARAITVSGITSFDVLARVREEISTVHAGADWNEAKKKIVEEIHPFLADPEDPENTAAAERRAETLLRTHGFQASQAAAFRNIDAQKEVFPYVEYHSMDDDRVRDTHMALDGLVFPFDSPFVHSHWCPWDYGCRCHWVPLSEDDAHDIRKGDAKLPPDQRTLIEGQALDHIQITGHLVRGINQITDVRTPVEKNGPEAYSFNPQDLHIPVDKLQGRYDSQTWNEFEKWSKKTPVHEGGVTVWEWMSGTKLPEAAPAKESQQSGGDNQPIPMRQAPVRNALDLHVGAKLKKIVSLSLSAIDKVHDDGSLPTIPLGSKTHQSNLGEFVHQRSGGAYNIGIKHSGPWPHLTTCHEVGHFLDYSAFGGNTGFATANTMSMAPFLKAAKESKAIKEIEASTLSQGQKSYLLQPHEIWARAYAQWISFKSGDSTLLDEVKKMAESSQPFKVWDEEDFKEVSKEIDAMFASKGWL